MDNALLETSYYYYEMAKESSSINKMCYPNTGNTT